MRETLKDGPLDGVMGRVVMHLAASRGLLAGNVRRPVASLAGHLGSKKKEKLLAFGL